MKINLIIGKKYSVTHLNYKIMFLPFQNCNIVLYFFYFYNFEITLKYDITTKYHVNRNLVYE